ncbi:hypothetical protein SLE2022_296140 [Rubroshorea leprosula]
MASPGNLLKQVNFVIVQLLNMFSKINHRLQVCVPALSQRLHSQNDLSRNFYLPAALLLIFFNGSNASQSLVFLPPLVPLHVKTEWSRYFHGTSEHLTITV